MRVKKHICTSSASTLHKRNRVQHPVVRNTSRTKSWGLITQQMSDTSSCSLPDNTVYLSRALIQYDFAAPPTIRRGKNRTHYMKDSLTVKFGLISAHFLKMKLELQSTDGFPNNALYHMPLENKSFEIHWNLICHGQLSYVPLDLELRGAVPSLCSCSGWGCDKVGSGREGQNVKTIK